jgi:hypothetical protein
MKIIEDDGDKMTVLICHSGVREQLKYTAELDSKSLLVIRT